MFLFLLSLCCCLCCGSHVIGDEEVIVGRVGDRDVGGEGDERDGDAGGEGDGRDGDVGGEGNGREVGAEGYGGYGGGGDELQNPTALQKYVWLSDTAFNYSFVTTLKQAGTMTYVIRLISQRWLTEQDTSIHLWNHWLCITVPDQLKDTNQANLHVDGGSNSATPPTTPPTLAVMLATRTSSIVGDLLQIPNEPAIFKAEGCCLNRTEDAILAYGWSHFLNDTSTPEWLVSFPMVKAVVRAMDVMQDFLPKVGFLKPEKFIISGASKRGWVTWLLPAVDKRVNAIVPMVIPILNTANVINQLWRSLGLWSFALADYFKMNLMGKINTLNFTEALCNEIDPAKYMNYLAAVPKYMVFSTGDEFFLPDSARNFYTELTGKRYLRMAPNTDHSLSALVPLLLNNIATFSTFIRYNQAIPEIEQVIHYSNTTATITVFPSQPPDEAKVWWAPTVTTKRRDFRLHLCRDPTCYQPVIWLNESLIPNPIDGSFTASMDAPGLRASQQGQGQEQTQTGRGRGRGKGRGRRCQGWIGFFIELSYNVKKYGSDSRFQLTSEVVIVPDVYPFPPCGNHCATNSTGCPVRKKNIL